MNLDIGIPIRRIAATVLAQLIFVQFGPAAMSDEEFVSVPVDDDASRAEEI